MRHPVDGAIGSKTRRFTRPILSHRRAGRGCAAVLTAAAAVSGFEYDKLFTLKGDMPLLRSGDTVGYYFDREADDGAYPRLDLPMREGGFSALALDPDQTDGTSFYTINDRGINVSHTVGGRNDKVFAFPGYTHKLMKFRVDGDSLTLVSIDSLKGLGGGAYTVGLPSTLAPTGEIGLAMNLETSVVDTAATLEPSEFGYDFEGMAFDGNGNLFLCDEYGPFLVQVDVATGTVVKHWYPGHGLPDVLAKRRANRGMEGLGLTPSGKLLGIVQSPMYNPSAAASRDSRLIRLVWLDPATDEVKEFIYPTDSKGGARRGRDVKMGDMVALSETEFLVLEHGNVGNKYWIDIYRIDISGASDITWKDGQDGSAASGRTFDGKTLDEIGVDLTALLSRGLKPVKKTLVVGDIMAKGWPHDKPEGLVMVDDTTLALVNDNDYGMSEMESLVEEGADDGIAHITPAETRVTQLMYLKVPSLSAEPAAFKLAILHNNDGESQLVDVGGGLEDFGGVARFKTLADNLKAKAMEDGAIPILLTSGDNFLAGPEFTAGRQEGKPMYDGVAMDLMGYDALCIGNHDFDFGPDVLAELIGTFEDSKPPFLSSNLDFSEELSLKALQDAGRIAKRTILEKGGQRIGVVGATTPSLDYISSPRKVKVLDEVAAIVQKEVDLLSAEGVNKIILISHLQSVAEDTALAKQLRGVDVMIAGGGDELLANEGTPLLPMDTLKNEAGEVTGTAIQGPYPIWSKNAEDVEVPIVTTAGDYRYLGQLIAEFDAEGNLTGIDEDASMPHRVLGGDWPDAVSGNEEMQEKVSEPVSAYVAALAQNVIGASEVKLDGVRNNIRGKETNLGDLIADALLWQARELAESFEVEVPVVALQNGGGIRNNNEIPSGDFTELHTFEILPFANFVAVVEGVTPAHLKEILENAVSLVEQGNGRFAQIAGMRIVYNPGAESQTLKDDGTVDRPGKRIKSIILTNEDETPIIVDGEVAEGAPETLAVATIDFLAKGGDQYPFRGLDFTTLGVVYQQALSAYVRESLDGNITEAQYPEGADSRIEVDEAWNSAIRFSGVDASRLDAAAWLRQGSVKIAFRLPVASDVAVEIYDLHGQKIASRKLGARPAGVGTAALPFDGGRGLYLLKLKAGKTALTRKIATGL